MNILKQLFGSTASAGLDSILKEGAFLVDVRSAGEFAQGNVSGSVNIPLDRLQAQLPQFKNKKNIVVFCRSGNRSAMAKTFLEQQGFTNVINGGTWDYVKRLVR
jgi:phage shock protein E